MAPASGMTCGRCVNAVTTEFSDIEGVTDVNVDLETGRATVASTEPLDRNIVAGLSRRRDSSSSGGRASTTSSSDGVCAPFNSDTPASVDFVPGLDPGLTDCVPVAFPVLPESPPVGTDTA